MEIQYIIYSVTSCVFYEQDLNAKDLKCVRFNCLKVENFKKIVDKCTRKIVVLMSDDLTTRWNYLMRTDLSMLSAFMCFSISV